MVLISVSVEHLGCELVFSYRQWCVDETRLDLIPTYNHHGRLKIHKSFLLGDVGVLINERSDRWI